MKKTLITAALLTAFGVAAVAPQASRAATPTNTSNGTITITGDVVSSTCSVAVNGGSASPTVTLPTVDINAFGGVASAATGWVPVSIVLTGCPASISGLTHNTVVPYFYGSNVDSATGYLKNSSGTSNVEVVLSNAQAISGALTLAGAVGSQNTTAQALSTSAITFSYYAGYISTSATTTAGTVNTSVQYDLVYQ
jgi:major type 1 subunit fimbrin (pilin)